jgi:hypothetical protein
MDYKSSIFEKESIVDLGDFELPRYGGLSIKLPLESVFLKGIFRSTRSEVSLSGTYNRCS